MVADKAKEIFVLLECSDVQSICSYSWEMSELVGLSHCTVSIPINKAPRPLQKMLDQSLNLRQDRISLPCSKVTPDEPPNLPNDRLILD